MFAFSQAALIFTLKLSCNANPACFLSLKKNPKTIMKNKKGSELLKTRPLYQSWSCAAEASQARWPKAAWCCTPWVLLWWCSECELLLLPLLQRQQSCASPVQLKGCAFVVVLQHSHLILSVQIKESGSENGWRCRQITPAQRWITVTRPHCKCTLLTGIGTNSLGLNPQPREWFLYPFDRLKPTLLSQLWFQYGLIKSYSHVWK